MIVTLFAISCTKEKPTTLPEVKEYFASKETNVKEEIRNFLMAAHPNLNVANKTNTVLTDKEPNEGAWLMEAAINVERYGRLDKDVVSSKTYQLEINNKILPDGLIKMDAVDILTKYNHLLSTIISDEIDQKVANLIDFQIIEINTEVTKIQVEVNFVYIIEPVVFEPETIVLPPARAGASVCRFYENRIIQGVTFDFDDVNFTSYDFTSFNPLTPNGSAYYSTGSDVSIAKEFHRIAENQGNIFNYPPYPNNPNGNFLLLGGNSIFIPYTNIHIVGFNNLVATLNCVGVWKSAIYAQTDYSFEISVLKQMIKEVENSLPNSSSVEYSLVQMELYGSDGGCTGTQCHNMELFNTVFVAYANN